LMWSIQEKACVFAFHRALVAFKHAITVQFTPKAHQVSCRTSVCIAQLLCTIDCVSSVYIVQEVIWSKINHQSTSCFIRKDVVQFAQKLVRKFWHKIGVCIQMSRRVIPD
jgi:hypothetical protein